MGAHFRSLAPSTNSQSLRTAGTDRFCAQGPKTICLVKGVRGDSVGCVRRRDFSVVQCESLVLLARFGDENELGELLGDIFASFIICLFYCDVKWQSLSLFVLG